MKPINLRPSIYYALSLILMSVISCSPDKKETTTVQLPESYKYQVELVTGDLQSPVLSLERPGTDTVLILSQVGKIYQFLNGKIQEDLYLDMSERMVPLDSTFSEMGLLGMAFHPEYNSNRKFYVFYNYKMLPGNIGSTIRISEFSYSGPGSETLDTEKVILQVDHPGLFVNGGHIEFGPDGYLYIGLGESVPGDAQKLENIFGSILRIDVENKTEQKYGSYSIPADNPFRTGSNPEIWAHGLRNPFRFTFSNNKLYSVDVGGAYYEEIDHIVKGGNYGWPKYEGPEQKNDDYLSLLVENKQAPLSYYEHDGSAMAITGLQFYQGGTFTELNEKFLSVDWNGSLFVSEPEAEAWKITLADIENIEEYSAAKNDTLIDEEGVFVLPKIVFNGLFKDKSGQIYILGQNKMGPYQKAGFILKLKQ